MAWTILLPRQVSAAAVRVTRQARREGLAGEAFGDRVAVLAAAQGLPAREEEALADLLAYYSAVQPDPRFRLRAGYTNGRHRTTAMLDAASAGPSSSAGDTPAEGAPASSLMP